MSIFSGTKLGRYEIRAKIGEGGMGEVYLAEDTQLHRKVALKVLPDEVAANQDRMRRFVQEAQSAAALNHPNVAHIYEIGEQDGVHFIAMEFIDGVTLRESIRDADLRKLLRYLQHIAEGLAKAHAAGIVHRDLKPENIMVEMDHSSMGGHIWLGRGYMEKGFYDEAIPELQRSVDAESGDGLAQLGYAYAMAGRKAEALKTLADLEALAARRYSSPVRNACIYSGLGDKERAFEWLEKGYAGRSDHLTQLKTECMFDSLRSDPRFADLLRRVGLPQ